jgi:hypothetical protein
MFCDHGKEPATYLRCAKHLASIASKCEVNSRAHNDYREVYLEYIRDRAALRMEKADR